MIAGLSYIVWYSTVFFYSSLLLLEPFAAYLDSDLTQIELMIWRNPEPKCVSLQTSENLSNEIKMWETESHDNYLLKVCLQAHLWLYNGLQEAKCFYQTENYIKRHWLRVRIIHSSDSTHCGHLWWQWLKRVNQISWISSHGVDVMTRSPDSRLANKMSFFVVFSFQRWPDVTAGALMGGFVLWKKKVFLGTLRFHQFSQLV